MNVIQTIPSIGLEASGTGYSVIGLCRGLHDVGVNVELHVPRPVPNILMPFRVSDYKQHSLLHLRGSEWSGELLNGLRVACRTADIIHTNGLWMLPNIYASMAVKGTACKLVTSTHGCLSCWALQRSALKKRIFGCLFQKRACQKTDMFHATSAKEYDEIRAFGYRQPIAVIPIGMDIPAFAKSEGKSDACRKVVFFGRIHQVKAVDRLVQAWEIIISDGRFQLADVENWELVIAGPDNGARGELEQYISDHKIPRVRFAGEINGPAKYEFLASADVYVLPSHTENFGVTVTEALACGTPVVTSKGTPWSGVVENGCGKWVDNAPESLAAAIGELMALSDDERRKMGEKGREWIQRDFSWDGVGLKMKMAYEWLLNPKQVAKPEWVRT